MALVSFVGRVLFASVFILSAWQEFNEFGVDGGPAAKALKPKFNVFSKTVTAHTGVEVPEFDIKVLVAAAVAFKGVGVSFLSLAALSALQQVIVTTILYDFYNYDTEKKEFGLLFSKFSQNLALLGALLFFVGMKNSIPRRQLKKKAPKTKTV
ncbi:hypothetical protein CXB51_025756 [Gossypium anomalum]|uniref:2-oxoglutarate (2OG) and Fe(II)-dependent oxygenase superfamily protein n=1 Tax=Gossypium anomalum TaxID=47600 RepID=A0A8J6CV36_9ROSI|nr:hypothetical protein CXB51_025756 [Gossypium anomalum]